MKSGTETPGRAKRIGRKVTLREDWDDVKDSFMRHLLRQKFSTNTEEAKMLAATGDAELEEGNTWGDTYWGLDLRSGAGENRLGNLLMEIRQENFERGTLPEVKPQENIEEGDLSIGYATKFPTNPTCITSTR